MKKIRERGKRVLRIYQYCLIATLDTIIFVEYSLLVFVDTFDTE